jgi:pimeloyl-ACP methyl ester carboxylesterase
VLGDEMNVAFPWGKTEEATYVDGAKKFGRACSTTGRPLSGSMSTAEVVRDMDVLRRAVGDQKLSYLGFSYGTAIGRYYANMFPDRFRAITSTACSTPSTGSPPRRPGARSRTSGCARPTARTGPFRRS